jgi:hypothetical protein
VALKIEASENRDEAWRIAANIDKLPQGAAEPMHTDPSTIWVICYQRTTQEPFPARKTL